MGVALARGPGMGRVAGGYSSRNVPVGWVGLPRRGASRPKGASTRA